MLARGTHDSDDAAVPTEDLAAAHLSYASDLDPGLRRRKAGAGFNYLDPDGEPVTDEATLDRIRALAIPPA